MRQREVEMNNLLLGFRGVRRGAPVLELGKFSELGANSAPGEPAAVITFRDSGPLSVHPEVPSCPVSSMATCGKGNEAYLLLQGCFLPVQVQGLKTCFKANQSNLF
jgi:hypothetical protein